MPEDIVIFLRSIWTIIFKHDGRVAFYHLIPSAISQILGVLTKNHRDNFAEECAWLSLDMIDGTDQYKFGTETDPPKNSGVSVSTSYHPYMFGEITFTEEGRIFYREGITVMTGSEMRRRFKHGPYFVDIDDKLPSKALTDTTGA